ncbi:MAG: hypothetical protein KJ709_01065 [Nanoarchaeota archaeon]|nr:hypothetical protein [Nanoarchaeota archaeon]
MLEGDRKKVLDRCLRDLRGAFPEYVYQPSLKSLELLFENFDLKSWEAAQRRGEVPTIHSGMVPSMFSETPYYLACGSRGRARDILSDHSKDIVQTIPPNYDDMRSALYGIYKDRFKGQEFNVGVLTTKEGPSAVEIFLGMDFLSVAPDNFTMVRPGTAGTMQKYIGCGSKTIATAALRAEGVSDKYVESDYVAVATPLVVAFLELAAERLGYDTKTGPKITKDSLQWEICNTPKRESARIAQKLARDAGILVSSMELSMICILADLYSQNKIHPGKDPREVRVGGIYAVVNDPPDCEGESLFTPDLKAIEQVERDIELISQESMRIAFAYDHGLLSRDQMSRLDQRAKEVDSELKRSLPMLRDTQRQIRQTYGAI